MDFNYNRKWESYGEPCPCGMSSDAFAIDINGDGYCFRNGCKTPYKKNFIEKGEIDDLEIIEDVKELEEPKGKVTFKHIPLRGISLRTIEFYDLKTKLIDDTPFETGFFYPELKKYKFRRHGENIAKRDRFHTDSGLSSPGLWGKDRFDPGSKDSVTICEGHFDAPSVYEMVGGITAAVSVNSSASALRDITQDREWVNSFKKIIILFDNDGPGEEAVKQVVTSGLFDYNKLYICKLSKHKDANDYLISGDVEDFRKVWKNSRRYTPDNIISTFSEIERALEESQEDLLAEYPWKFLNDNLYGIHKGDFIVFKGDEGIGKQLPITTRVPTPSGWKLLKDIKVGDIIFNEEGMETEVKFVTPIQYNIPCYEITFNDKTKQIAGGPHRWSVLDSNNRSKIKTTEEMFKEGTLIDVPNGYKKARYSVPLTKPVEYKEKDLLIDPYLLGYWLGDGHSYSDYISVGDQDKHNWANFLVRREKTAWVVRHPNLTYKKLNSLNLIKNKHIPKEYLLGSINQRRELLKGLLDSDGSGTKFGVEFYSSNKILISQVFELIQSLGYAPRIRTKKSKLNGKNYGEAYTIYFLVKDGSEVFKFNRKIKSTKKCKTTRLIKKSIRKIIPVESVPSICIEVDSPSHLYLIDNYLVTHNTETFRAIEHFTLKTTGVPIGIIHLEEDNATTIKGLVGYELNIPATLPDSGLTKEDILKGYRNLVKDDEGRVHIYSSFETEDETIFLDNVRFLASAAGCKLILLDHITWLATGMDNEDERKKLDRLSQKLKLLAKELKIAIIIISHTNDDGKTRGSRNISKAANTVIHLSRDKLHLDPLQRNILNFDIEKARLGGKSGPSVGKAIFNNITGKLESYNNNVDHN